MTTPERRTPAEILRILTEGTAASTGDAFFRSLARHAAQALGARYAFVAETVSALESRSLAYWEGSGFGEGFSYRFPGTPCQRVAAGHVCATSARLQELFPEDRRLVDIGAESYVGVPMRSAEGRVVGHIAVLHTTPMEPSAEEIAVLQVFASRGCAELERVQAERALRAALAELEVLRERLQNENRYLRDELRTHHDPAEIVGESAALGALLDQLERVAASDATVLVSGETGTGKELVARAIHARGPRRDRPLVKLNCGAIAPGLVESELFGHVRGAFTGAESRRVGRFELADGGTLFLDEVGELPLDTQVKLLRVLQERELEPVGSDTARRVDVRVIAATNRDLGAAIADGRFRADLYYRLAVVPLRVPPLRERRDDVPRLAEHFLERHARRLGRTAVGFSSATLARLAAYDWPGNVRELQNLVERGVVLARGPIVEIDPGARADAGGAMLATSLANPLQRSAHTAPAIPRGSTLADRERDHIRSVLDATGWVIEGPTGAARVLGIHASTLRSRLKKLGIRRDPT